MKALTEIRGILKAQKPYLAERFGVAEIGVFGSYERDEQRPDSDIDILIELEEPPRIDLLDLVNSEVTFRQFRCWDFGRTFRHYPKGVGLADQSLRLQQSAAICWVLGLSFRGIEEDDSGVFNCSICRNARMSCVVMARISGSAASKNDRNRAKVTGYHLSLQSKASLGCRFISAVETDRFKYWYSEDKMISEQWWFFQQVKACTFYLPPGGQSEKHLRWYGSDTAKVSAPTGLQPIHDDRLISAALVAVYDDLYRTGKLTLGQAKSAIISPDDPLSDLSF